MKVTWATDYYGEGNSYGYSVHNMKSREAIAAAGVELVPDADIVLHVAPGHLFKPVEGRINVLYTAWEMEVLPPRYVEAYGKADAVIVSASYLVNVVKKCLPDKPVFLCHEGVDVETFWYKRRDKPGIGDRGSGVRIWRPGSGPLPLPPGPRFRFLWIGAPNARKGWELVVSAFGPFLGDPRFELYLKTTITDKILRSQNVIFDSRNYTIEQLRDLYHSAHCFVFPSFGEGFGLTMAEAMATGLPVVYTPWSSLTDLADESCGYPVKYKMIDTFVRGTGGIEPTGESPDAVPAQLAQADPVDVAEKMIEVYEHYKRALKKGLRAARRICTRFTWQRTGRRLKQICESLMADLSAVPLA